MQTLDVISINIWQIIISLANLLILFLILKKFLFKPVKNMLTKRQEEVDSVYAAANEANKSANENKEKWQQILDGASAEADSIIHEATATAAARSEKMIDDAKQKAENIVEQAQTEAELYLKKAQAGVKTEIIDVSAILAEKMLRREINSDDHRALIDSVIENIGDIDDSDE